MQINHPDLWHASFPTPKADGHKYDRGHAVVLGGPQAQTGAARLAARAALRSGAGLVSIASETAALPVYAAACEAVMVKPTETVEDFSQLVTGERITALLLGPNAGRTPRTRLCVEVALAAHKPTVLDADALTIFEGESEALFSRIAAPCVLTPHAGEYARLFDGEPTEKALRQAALHSGAVLVAKGFLHTASSRRMDALCRMKMRALTLQLQAQEMCWPASSPGCSPKACPHLRRPVRQYGCMAEPARHSGWV